MYLKQFKLLSNKSSVFITPVPIHISTPPQQMADKLSLLVILVNWKFIENALCCPSVPVNETKQFGNEAVVSK